MPQGRGLRLRRGVRRYADGTLVVGGAPRRVVRLTVAGAALLDDVLRRGVGKSVSGQLARRLVETDLAEVTGERWDGRPPTVVVPARDRPEALDRCLGSLSLGSRVVVVDDGSADPAALAGVAARHGAGLLRRAASGGPAAARNAGVDAVLDDVLDDVDTGGVVAFVDSDVTVGPVWWELLCRRFADPAVVAVAPRVLPEPAARPGSVLARYSRFRSALDLGAAGGTVRPGSPVGYVPSTVLLVRSEALKGVRFDEALRYGEDVDLVWRLGDAGGVVCYDSTVVVRHREPAGWAELLRRRHRYGGAAGPLARRHGDRLAPARFRPMPLATVAALVAGRPAVAGLLTVGGAAVAHRRLRAARVPAPAAAAAATAGTGHAAVGTAAACGRLVAQFAAPAAVLLAVRRPATRGAVTVLLAVDPMQRWWRDRPPLDPLRWTLACLADDAAYGSGVVAGALRARTATPLIPLLPTVTSLRVPVLRTRGRMGGTRRRLPAVRRRRSPPER